MSTTELASPMLAQAKCEPTAVVAGEPVRITAEVRWTGQPPSAIPVRVRAANREIVERGRLQLLSASNRKHTARYAFEWTTAEDTKPGAYDILLRLPGARRSSITSVTVFETSMQGAFAALGNAAQLTSLSRQMARRGDLGSAIFIMEKAIAAYEAVPDPEAAAEALLDAADLCLQVNDHAGARQLLNKALAIRERSGDMEGAAYCRLKLAAARQPSGLGAHGD